MCYKYLSFIVGILLLLVVPQGFADIDTKKNIELSEVFTIDASDEAKELATQYGEDIIYEWDLQGASTKIGPIFERSFNSSGEKEINLNIYSNIGNEKKLIQTRDYRVFVYEKSIGLIYDISMGSKKLEDFIDLSKKEGIYLHLLEKTTEKEINTRNILSQIQSYTQLYKNRSNYILIWWEKDFVLSALSRIEQESVQSPWNELNIVLTSPFNVDVLKNYIKNFLSNKSALKRGILIEESSRFQVINAPSTINGLITELTKNNYPYIEINTQSKISQSLFLSQFINTLSNNGYNLSGIYLILIIPFLFTGIAFIKHMVGLSPVGTLIPVAMVLLVFSIGLIGGTIIIASLIIINILIGKIINRYTLLYTPKISFIMTINIIVFSIIIMIMYHYHIIGSNINDIMFIILFIIISERLITLVISKDFGEYKYNLVNTAIFVLLTYLLFSIPIIQLFLLAYPEIILLLAPINFIIGKFTGLRATEYFRFREVIKSIEE